MLGPDWSVAIPGPCHQQEALAGAELATQVTRLVTTGFLLVGIPQV